MSIEEQQEQASLYVLGALGAAESAEFEARLAQSPELRELVRGLGASMETVTRSLPLQRPSAGLKGRILDRISGDRPPAGEASLPPIGTALRFLKNAGESGWKALPLPGAWIKVLSYEPERGYAILLGKLDPGVRYPAHVNAGPEDFLILSGDLNVSGRRLEAGDFHHADAGSYHEVNHSDEGCVLLAVLTTADPLVAMALA